MLRGVRDEAAEAFLLFRGSLWVPEGTLGQCHRFIGAENCSGSDALSSHLARPGGGQDAAFNSEETDLGDGAGECPGSQRQTWASCSGLKALQPPPPRLTG